MQRLRLAAASPLSPPDGSSGLRAADPMEAPSRAGIAWQGRSATAINSFHVERGSQHGKGDGACKAGQGEEGTLSFQRCWVVHSSARGSEVQGGRTGCEVVWEQRPFEGVPEEGLEPLVPTWFWST